MITKSEYIFALACIPSRILLTLFAKDHYHPVMSIISLIVAVQFFRLWRNPGLRPTGIETFGTPIWWGDMRSVHALLWLLFAITSFQGREYAWKFLALDVIVGLVNFLFLKPRGA